jgi:hypothetical protein
VNTVFSPKRRNPTQHFGLELIQLLRVEALKSGAHPASPKRSPPLLVVSEDGGHFFFSDFSDAKACAVENGL